MKTLATILLCLLPWGVRAQYELPAPNCDTLVVHPFLNPEDSVLINYPVRMGQQEYLTRADVQRMIEETVKARIDSALAAQGRWVQVIKEVWIYNRHNNGGMTCVGHDCRDSAQECHWRVDTTWVWTRPEEKP